jgi:hypothetical protein
MESYISKLSLADQVRNAVLAHEDTAPNVLTLGTTNLSGYSIGLTQFDFSQHAGEAVVETDFKHLLDSTAQQTGLSATDI